MSFALRLMSYASCLMPYVSSLMPHVLCLILSYAVRLMYRVLCLTSYASRLMPYVSCLISPLFMSYVSCLMPFVRLVSCALRLMSSAPFGSIWLNVDFTGVVSMVLPHVFCLTSYDAPFG